LHDDLGAEKTKKVSGGIVDPESHIQSYVGHPKYEGPPMKFNTLGRTGLLVSEICLGTMTFAPGEGIWKSIAGVDQRLAEQLLKVPSRRRELR
jgi:hypothetical protein